MHKYILTHKDMEPVKGFEIIDNRENKELDHRMFSEIAGFKILFDMLNEKNDDGSAKYGDNEWISLNHYRREFEKDAVDRTYVPQPLQLPYSVAAHYATYHNIEDLKLCGQAVKEEFPNLVQAFEQIMNGNIFIPYNMCITTVAQFRDLCNFLFKTLDNMHKKIGTETYEERLDYVKRHPEWYTGEHKNNDPVYAARIESFCTERLSSFYWLYVSKQMPVFPAKIIKTEGAW